MHNLSKRKSPELLLRAFSFCYNSGICNAQQSFQILVHSIHSHKLNTSNMLSYAILQLINVGQHLHFYHNPILNRVQEKALENHLYQKPLPYEHIEGTLFPNSFLLEMLATHIHISNTSTIPSYENIR